MSCRECVVGISLSGKADGDAEGTRRKAWLRSSSVAHRDSSESGESSREQHAL